VDTALVTLSRALKILGSGLLVIALAVALSGCGSDDDSESSGATTSGTATSLDGWAQGLCTAVASWQASVQATSAKLANSQADFASASEAITSANEALTGSLEGLGTPPAPASSQAKDAIDELSANLEEGAGEIEQALTGNFTTQSEIAQASSQAKASLSTMQGDISKTVAELKALPDEEGWKQSFQTGACQAVANG
jgi:hypothetical protein